MRVPPLIPGRRPGLFKVAPSGPRGGRFVLRLSRVRAKMGVRDGFAASDPMATPWAFLSCAFRAKRQKGRLRLSRFREPSPTMRRIIAFGILAASLFSGCGKSCEELNSRVLEKAKASWKKAGVKSYNLWWSTSGVRKQRYRVFVRDGQVKRIDMLQEGGGAVEAKPGSPSMFGVEGLFKTLREELDQLESDKPFGQPKGAKAVLCVEFDPKLSFPKRYLRDVMGSGRGLEIDVETLLPQDASAEIPPLDEPKSR